MRVDPRPYRQVQAEVLAQWLERSSPTGTWLVDGDPLLTARLDFPAPTDELAAEIRHLGFNLFVRARPEDQGQPAALIGSEELDRLVIDLTDGREDPPAPVRALYLRWENDDVSEEWVLSEDTDDD